MLRLKEKQEIAVGMRASDNLIHYEAKSVKVIPRNHEGKSAYTYSAAEISSNYDSF